MHARRVIGVGALIAGASLAAAPNSSTRPVPRCDAQHLRLVAGFQGVGLGSFGQTFTFVNASRRQCHLEGWPALELGRSRRVVQGALSAHPFTTVVLAPGDAASFNVYGEDWDHVANRACPKTATVRVAPPGEPTALTVHVKMPNCGLFYIAPLIPGRIDRRSWSVVWHS
jgi:hypothetical protein